MTDSYITAKIRRVKQDPRYTELLLLQRLPMLDPEEPEMGPAAAAAPQASTCQESPSSCYIVGLGPNCKFIDLLFKRLVITFNKISSFIVSLF